VEEIRVSGRPDGAFDVEIAGPQGQTHHRVTVPDGLVSSIARRGTGEVDRTELVRASFAFLLEREPATSILRSFSLDVIQDYFPEYSREIPGRLGHSGRRPGQ
jgi:hypothetical protein